VKIVVGESSLKPYWGKPAVRNFRGGEGNVSTVWRLFATQPERADTTEADRPKLGAPSLHSVVLYYYVPQSLWAATISRGGLEGRPRPMGPPHDLRLAAL
jgi:hypothetical protein